MVQCSAQSSCPHGEWFHLECKGLQEKDISDEDWWCSPECQIYSIFCCKVNKNTKQWIGCSSEKNCLKGEWFHIECTGLKKLPSEYLGNRC